MHYRATIRDNAGNNADLTGAATQLTGVLRIDTKPPGVTSVVAGPADGDLGVGGIITLTVNFDDRVRVGGISPATTPTLLAQRWRSRHVCRRLRNQRAGVHLYGRGGTEHRRSGGNRWAGAEWRDHPDFAGNDANVKGAGKNPTGKLQIDGTAPTVSSIVATPKGDLDSGKTIS